MKPIDETNSRLYFLSGGGETGKLVRNFDWSQTILGQVDFWPQSLISTISILLTSKLPMFLWWGEELIQFYNDASRSSLDIHAKRSQLLGKTIKQCGPELPESILYRIRQVLETGKASSIEDQLMPLCKDGKMEEVNWTFNFSPVYDESSQVVGVLAICTETTEKVKSHKTLYEIEQQFRTLTEASDVLVAISDADWNLTYLSKAWEELTGKRINKLLNMDWSDLLQADDREIFLNNYQKALKNKESFVWEFRILDKDGNYRWLLAKVKGRFDPEGIQSGFISSCIDITENKQAEMALKQSEERFRAVVESAPFPIGVMVGKELRIELANKTVMDIWGKGYDIIGKSFKEVLPELENQEIFQQVDQVYATGIPFHAKRQLVDLLVDGKLKHFYFNYSFTPLFDAFEKVYGVLNTGADITDLKLAKLQVQENERNLRHTLLQAPVAICILKGPDYVVELANEKMIELWGKTSEEVMNKPVFEGVPEARNQGLEEKLNGVYQTGKSFLADGVPLKLFRKGKMETVYVNFLYEPHWKAEGGISGILSVAVDVTQEVLARQKIEEVVAKRTHELAEAIRDLKKSNAELAQFAYIASHDLQEPLRKISMFSKMLEKRMDKEMDDQSKTFLDKIQSSSSRMNLLIRDVLSFSELVNETEAFTDVDLNQVVEKTLIDYELMIEEKQATIHYEVLPKIKAIPLQMSQLFSNIIGNALKFGRQGTNPVINISVSEVDQHEKENSKLDPKLDYYKIVFKDNGIGFKNEYKDQIFNIFQRLHGKMEYQGTGIGLAICKKIVLNHQGDLHAEGSSQNGAVFTAILPKKLPKKSKK